MFKKINFAIFALLLGAGLAFAFNAPVTKPANKLAVQWFLYNGGGESNPNNYSELPGMPSCAGAGVLCAIEAPENGSSGKPTQSGVNSPISTRKYD
ncbi:hypothetical protein [Daejeonella oryzae]|uniref:hypothetical protein n=1 Tax=Daejeonella oryzae TaxID=1122943 RepID=UPI0003F82DFA|nr:hypothetical protein [Daejeonella oryzae]